MRPAERPPGATAWGATALALALAAGCAGPAPGPEAGPYRPDLRDYATFRVAFPEVLEPNYLPFMVHRIPQQGGRDDLLIFCRWDDADMPLSVFVETPEIPDDLQDEFLPRDPADYARGVERALETWERHLEGLVRFERVAARAQARLRIELLGERAPIPEEEVKVLGTTRVGDACRVRAWDPDAERVDVSFEVSALRIFVADEFGLLSDEQVEWIALHEIGHALGMRSHSPIPADLMYEIVRDRLSVAEGLSFEDVNSFLSLYRLPNGTVFGSVPRRGSSPRDPMPPPTGPPMLELAPYVDPRLGFSLRTPHGWLTLDTGQGMVAVNGVTWDYAASLQVVVTRYATIEDFLERYGPYYVRSGRLLRSELVVVDGRRAVRGLVRRAGPAVEQVTLIESGDGRVLVVTAECAAEDLEAYAPWFEAALATLDVWSFPPGRR